MSFIEKGLVEWLCNNYAGKDIKLTIGGSARGWWFWNDVQNRHEKYSLVWLKDEFGMQDAREMLRDLIPIEVSWGDVGP